MVSLCLCGVIISFFAASVQALFRRPGQCPATRHLDAGRRQFSMSPRSLDTRRSSLSFEAGRGLGCSGGGRPLAYADLLNVSGFRCSKLLRTASATGMTSPKAWCTVR